MSTILQILLFIFFAFLAFMTAINICFYFIGPVWFADFLKKNKGLNFEPADMEPSRDSLLCRSMRTSSKILGFAWIVLFIAAGRESGFLVFIFLLTTVAMGFLLGALVKTLNR